MLHVFNLLAFFYLPLHAEPPRPDVGQLQTSGPACPQGSARGALGLEMNYGITFISDKTEAVSTKEDVTDTKHCSVKVKVTPAPGYQMKVDKFLLNGWHITHGNSTTEIEANYALYTPNNELIGKKIGKVISPRYDSPEDDMERAVGLGQEEGDFEIAWNMPSDDWSPCGQSVTLKSELNLTATRAFSPQNNAEIALHNANTRFASHMVWAWAFRPCHSEPEYSLEGDWFSQYTLANGQQVEAKIQVRGTEGTYKTPSFTGNLFAITYEGKVAQGYWQAGTTKGWFKFTFLNPRKFAGEWGLNDFGSPSLGRWWGKH